MPDITRDLFLAFVRVHVLHHAVEGPVYGAEMIAELGRHGYSISPGTLYPILHSMAGAGLLACQPQVVSGKVRKYYRATDSGREALEQIRPKLRELISEALPAESD